MRKKKSENIWLFIAGLSWNIFRFSSSYNILSMDSFGATRQKMIYDRAEHPLLFTGMPKSALCAWQRINMKRAAGIVALAWLGATSSIRVNAEVPSNAVVFTHVTVIDVTGTSNLTNVTVECIGNRIKEVGEDGSLSIPQNARVIDADGKFLIPGLWDMHVHLGNATEAALPVLIASGVTGVRDMGSPSFETLRRWRVEALTGDRTGPRIVAAGPILDGGTPDPTRMIVRNEAEARRAVDYLAECGVDFIKVHEHLSRETYFAIADEARKLNLPFAGHVPTDPNKYLVSGMEASAAGQKCLEHLFGIPFPFQRDGDLSGLFEAFRRNGTWVDPTLTRIWSQAHLNELVGKDDPRLKYVAPALRQFWAEQVRGISITTNVTINVTIPTKILKWRLADVKALNAAGIPLLAGTDLGGPYVFPGDLHKELELLVEAGLSPLEALRTATINPARYLGWQEQLGSVEKGKLADLVLLDANPIEDVRNTTKINAVVFNGRLLDRKALDQLLAGVEAAVK